jgi:hypothetical protein
VLVHASAAVFHKLGMVVGGASEATHAPSSTRSGEVVSDSTEDRATLAAQPPSHPGGGSKLSGAPTPEHGPAFPVIVVSRAHDPVAGAQEHPSHGIGVVSGSA